MTIAVLAAHAAPVFDSQNGWQVLEGQQLAFSVFSYDPDNPYYTPPLRNSEGDVDVTSPTPQTDTVEVLGHQSERAPCRDSVSQYVKNAVVAVTLIKK